jgi:Ca-activated chloride channel family protein
MRETLIVYSSNAFTVTPLTTDTDTIAALVNSVSTDIMPSRGSYPIAAIEKGRQLLQQAGAGAGEILLITDGGSSPAAERVARDLKASGYSLSVLAVGTSEGAPIPRASGGFVTDRSGQIAVPKLEEHSLRALAVAGGGRFATLTTDDRDLGTLLSGEVAHRAAGDESLATDRWREEGPWLVFLLLPLAAMAFRRGWVLLVALAILPLSQPAEASVWDDIWMTRDQQAQRKLQQGEVADAVELFENPDWRAVSQYRAEDYAESAAAFAENEDTRSLYNLGNALARQGELESAIDANEQVLEVDPDDADAEYNRDLLAQLLEQQQQEQEQQQESSDQQGEGEQSESDGESQESSESEEGSKGEPQEGDSQRDEEEASQEDLDALQEELQRAAEEAQQNEEMVKQLTQEELEALRREQEQQQAMEQWLRRIPNDPGGLLRRKFRYQYQKTGKDQDGNNTWPDDEVQPW